MEKENNKKASKENNKEPKTIEESKTIEELKPKFEKFVIHTAVYDTLLTEKYKNRKKYEPLNPKLIVSQIPGTVRQIFVKKGQKVEEGEMLLELEAMKMYNKILSPIKGVIKTIHVQKDETIPKATLMVELK